MLVYEQNWETSSYHTKELPMAKDTFHNEPAADFSQVADRRRMSDALASVRASFGRDYPLFINGEDLPGRPTAASPRTSWPPAHWATPARTAESS